MYLVVFSGGLIFGSIGKIITGRFQEEFFREIDKKPGSDLWEIFFGFLFLICYLSWGWNWDFLVRILFLCFAFLLAFLDWLYLIVPDELIIPGLYSAWFAALIGDSISLFAAISGGVVCAGFLVLFFVLFPGKMGFGDIKIGLLIGSFLGISKGINGIILGAFLGLFFFAGLLLFKKGSLKTPIPFGSFILMGSWLSFFTGDLF